MADVNASRAAALAKARRLASRADAGAIVAGSGAAISSSILRFSYADPEETDAAALRSDWTSSAIDLWSCIYRVSEAIPKQERLFDPERIKTG